MRSGQYKFLTSKYRRAMDIFYTYWGKRFTGAFS
jgi:hypothetical protein